MAGIQDIRNNLDGTVVKFIVGFIVIAFVGSIGWSAFFSSSDVNEVASVDDIKIDVTDLNFEMRAQDYYFQERFGNQDLNLDEEMLQKISIESLIRKASILSFLKESSLEVTDSVAYRELAKDESFEEDGKFSLTKFEAIARSQGYVPNAYLKRVKEDIALGFWREGVGSSTFVTNSEILENLRLAEQTRDVEFIRLNLQAILNNVTTTTEDVKNFYNNNSQLFLTSKLAKIKYIELSSKNLEEDVSIGESALREEYDLYLENFDTSVKKTISHLMLNIDEGENKSEVIALAKELKSQVTAGSDFIVLVKEYSDDEGTKDNGGELGVTDGSVFPPEFEEVIALMEEGSLSDPVELDESIHLLLLKDTQAPIADTFEEKREAILLSISEDLASDRFVELLDQASDLSFSLNDLEAIAKELNLSTQAVDYFSKEGASEVLSNPKVLELLFENLDFQNDPTIEVVETQENEALIILLEDFKQQEVTPFDSVELQATVMYKKELATGALDELEAQIIDTLDTGSNLALIATEQNVELESYQDLSRNSSLLSGSVMLDIFNLPRTNLDKAFGSSELDNGDSIVYRLKAINDKETAITPEEKLTFREFIGEERQVSELSELQLASQQSANIIRKF